MWVSFEPMTQRGEETIFLKIIRGEIPAKKVFENEHVLAFHDIQPQAPVHVLIIPKEVLRNLNEAREGDEQMLGRLLVAAKDIAAQLGVSDSGYRLVINNGIGAGQTVWHLHVHLLAGRGLQWPPG